MCLLNFNQGAVMSKGHILYVGNFELPDKNAAAHRVLNNAKLFRELGYHTVFLGINKVLAPESQQDISKQKPTIIQGFDSYVEPYPRSALKWTERAVGIGNVRKLYERYPETKCIIYYNYGAMAMWRAKRFFSRRSIRVLADLTEWYYPGTRNPLKKLELYLRMKVVPFRLDGLILVSRFFEKYYAGAKSVFVPPLVDGEDEKWQCEPFVYDEEQIHFAYAGDMKNKDKINCFLEALDLFSEKRNYILRIAGVTKTEYLFYNPEYKDLLDRLGNRVCFLGRISHQESIRVTKSSDYYVFFRDKTIYNQAGFPTKFTEAVTCNTHVITNKTSNIEEFFTEDTVFLLEVPSIDNIQSVLKGILTDPVKKDKTQSISNSPFDYRNFVLTMRQFLESNYCAGEKK